MTVQKFRQKILVDGHFAAIQGGELGLVVVNNDHIMTEIGEACPCHQTNVPRTDYSDLHSTRTSTVTERQRCLERLKGLLYQLTFMAERYSLFIDRNVIQSGNGRDHQRSGKFPLLAKAARSGAPSSVLEELAASVLGAQKNDCREQEDVDGLESCQSPAIAEVIAKQVFDAIHRRRNQDSQLISQTGQKAARLVG